MSAVELPAWRLDDVRAEDMLTWVELLRDDNAIHVDPAAAAALGYGHRTVNPGPANLAYLLNMLLAARPDDYPAEIEARFVSNILSGDAVEVTGTCDGDTCTARLTVPATGAVALEATVRLRPLEDGR